MHDCRVQANLKWLKWDPLKRKRMFLVERFLFPSMRFAITIAAAVVVVVAAVVYSISFLLNSSQWTSNHRLPLIHSIWNRLILVYLFRFVFFVRFLFNSGWWYPHQRVQMEKIQSNIKLRFNGTIFIRSIGSHKYRMWRVNTLSIVILRFDLFRMLMLILFSNAKLPDLCVVFSPSYAHSFAIPSTWFSFNVIQLGSTIKLE